MGTSPQMDSLPCMDSLARSRCKWGQKRQVVCPTFGQLGLIQSLNLQTANPFPANQVPENMGVAVTAADALTALGVHVSPNSQLQGAEAGEQTQPQGAQTVGASDTWDTLTSASQVLGLQALCAGGLLY